MAIFVSADTHYSNIGIIKHCSRNFLGRNEMDLKQIQNHNKVITNKDDYICVGDWCLQSKWNKMRHKAIMSMLNGRRKTLILGNHDKTKSGMLDIGFDRVYKKMSLGKILMIHKPQDAVKLKPPKDSIIITGHCHNNTPQFYTLHGYKIVNIGVDLWDFHPIALKTILKEYRRARFPDITKQFTNYEKRKHETTNPLPQGKKGSRTNL
jgi:calcineurin-like phosphoesterase family protein